MLNDNFSWVETHKQLTNYLKTQEKNQEGLIELLKSEGIGPFNDKSKEGDYDITLDEIDPFTFFCYIHKYGTEKRISILQSLAEKLNLTSPKGDFGIPTAQPQRVWLFPYKYQRTNNEITRLWSFFYKVLEGSLTDENFEDVLKIQNVGKTKLTEGLFYIQPEQYLPINGPTIPYIKEVFKLNPNFKNYSEYISLLGKIRKKTDEPFYKISYDAWDWNNKQKSQKMNYWIFQGNPKVFDFETALREEKLDDWTVTAHKDKMKVGDKVILWITGEKSGCYALAEIEQEPYEKNYSHDGHLWKTESKIGLKADIVITHNLVEKPLLKTEIAGIKELSKLKVGNQGTNFSATQKEYETILNLIENSDMKKYWLYAPGLRAVYWDEFYDSGIIGLGWDRIGDLAQYKNEEDIRQALILSDGRKGSRKNDVAANWSFIKLMQPGDVVIAKKGRYHYIGYGVITSEYYYDSDRKVYQKCRNVDWKKRGSWKETEQDIVVKTLTDITKYPEYVEKLIKLIGIEEDVQKAVPASVNYPLNTIFYGPPGTGKTYNTVLRAAEIVENRKIESYSEALEIFNSKLHDQIEFITFHQNYSYEDFIQGLRPDTENEKDLIFERKDGVFKIISDKALRNLLDSEKRVITKKSFEEAFDKFIEPLVDGEQEEIEVKMKRVSFFITNINKNSIDFRKASGGTAHTLSISTLKKMYDDEATPDRHGLNVYYDPLLKEVLKIGKNIISKKEKVDKKNYVLIIDEINRANISRVFGELITLIEPDKRSHGEIPLTAQLPSGDIFIVPSNLFIIGTMNTADKSIALLDIALRRRFEFESMYPLYKIENAEVYDVDILKKINKQIIKSKGYDFQIGHAYFMGENSNLVQRMNNKVIPLLLEYYMNDEKEVKDILSSAGLNIEENAWPIRITGKA